MYVCVFVRVCMQKSFDGGGNDNNINTISNTTKSTTTTTPTPTVTKRNSYKMYQNVNFGASPQPMQHRCSSIPGSKVMYRPNSILLHI